jgi:hypothetical protein
MKTLFYLIFSGYLLGCLLGCQEKQVQRGFYFWKSEFKLNQTEQNALQNHKIRRLYIKYFDVDLRSDHTAIPVAALRALQPIPKGIEVVPTVFVMNRVFQDFNTVDETSRNQKVKLLAQNIARKIQAIDDLWPENMPEIEEIQIDCDWTAGTKNIYFTFLEALKKQIHTKISVTVRLYQFKNRTESGIPPVDRGMFMLYNLTNPRKFADKNSIFDLNEAQKYVKDQSPYPLPMDVVLPIFSWGVAFHNESFAALLNGMNTAKARKLRFLKEEKPHLFISQADTVYRDIFFRQGDHIRIEEINENTLSEAVKLGKSLLNSPNSNLVLFHLDSSLIQNYSHESLENAFRLHF